jgi:hypothetical protein
MEAILSTEMSVKTISTWRHIPENCFLHKFTCLLVKPILFSGSQPWSVRATEVNVYQRSCGVRHFIGKLMKKLWDNYRFHK